MSVIDDYLKNIPKPKREQLERLRTIAKKEVPGAVETISYGMPALKYKSKAFLGFNALKDHIGIYPFGGEEIELFNKELTKLGYGYSKGAIRVPIEVPIPEKLLIKIIKHRIGRISAK